MYAVLLEDVSPAPTFQEAPTQGPSPTMVATVSPTMTTPPDTLPKTGDFPTGIVSIGLLVLLAGVAIQLAMRKLRRSE